MSDTTDDDLATLLAKREHARPNRLTWVLLVLLVLAVGFAGGAFAEKRNSSSSSTLPDFAALSAGGFPGGGSFPGGGAFPGGGTDSGGAATDASGAVTTGTVKLVDGSSLYITDAEGNTIKVVVPASVPVTTQSPTSLGDLAAGSTVVVQGETAEDGTVTATSVSEGTVPRSPNTATASSAPSPQGDNS